ncbi:arabinogalactan O-methyltransferase 1-like [Rutidosis leptorrhynchoides]|uniref:arabinogalactan O-methyltransferase 1-like n=1 Tax=Rutidosis leptorrhynchoides TaxID=125765 RepID=UPI003A9910AA
MKNNNNPPLPERRLFLALAGIALITGSLVVFTFIGPDNTRFFCNQPKSDTFHSVTSPFQLKTILHYATSRIVPQQSFSEISVSFNVLRSISPCNFLVFGLGHDSLMWASFNSRGKTLFLEEDPTWVRTVLKDAPELNAEVVKYRTMLSQADELMRTYRSEPECAPDKSYIKGNIKCRLALASLPDEVYEKEWDMIMIDAPRGWFAEAPGRMAAIYSATVMARNRKKPGVTHVFLHDVNRKVEKEYANEFLCKKYLKHSVGRLWHFEIPPVSNATVSDGGWFC